MSALSLLALACTEPTAAPAPVSTVAASLFQIRGVPGEPTNCGQSYWGPWRGLGGVAPANAQFFEGAEHEATFYNSTCGMQTLWRKMPGGELVFLDSIPPRGLTLKVREGQAWVVKNRSGHIHDSFDGRFSPWRDPEGDGFNLFNGDAYPSVVLSRFPARVVEGSPVVFSSVGSSDGDDDYIWFNWWWGDGEAQWSGAWNEGTTETHTYADDGTFEFNVRAYGAEEAGHEIFRTVTVENAPPVIRTLLLDFPVLNRPAAGAPWSIGFRWSDPGVRDAPWSYRIEWGDGAVTTGTRMDPSMIRAVHAYATPGERVGRIVITDKDGGTGSRDFTVVVR